jgi:hypothetical protein
LFWEGGRYDVRKVLSWESWAWWLTPVISVLRRLRQEDHKFSANLDYTVRPRLKEKRGEGKKNMVRRGRRRRKGRTLFLWPSEWDKESRP